MGRGKKTVKSRVQVIASQAGMEQTYDKKQELGERIMMGTETHMRNKIVKQKGRAKINSTHVQIMNVKEARNTGEGGVQTPEHVNDSEWGELKCTPMRGGGRRVCTGFTKGNRAREDTVGSHKDDSLSLR